MNYKSILLLTVSLYLLSIVGCKKDGNPDKFECANSAFSVFVTEKIVPTTIEEDNKGNIYVFGYFNDQKKIIKTDPAGQVLWTKTFDVPGKAQDLVYVNKDAVLMKTSTHSYEYVWDENLYENVWIRNGQVLDETNNYTATYELGDIQPQLRTPNENTTYLTKINAANGEVLWSKEFYGDAARRGSFYRIDSDNFLMLTSEFWGPYFKPVEQDGSVDTIDIPFDQNRRTVYKINAEGEVLWSTLIENIFNVSWYDGDFDYLMVQDISQTNEKIIVNTLNNTFELTLNGQLVNQYQPEYNFQGNHTMYMVKGSGSDFYFAGMLNRYGEMILPEYYLMKFNVSTLQMEWYTPDIPMPMQFSAYPGKELLLLNYGTGNYYELIKYHPDGQMLWKKDLTPKLSQHKLAMEAACNGGAIVALYDPLSQVIQLIKTNENGEY